MKRRGSQSRRCVTRYQDISINRVASIEVCTLFTVAVKLLSVQAPRWAIDSAPPRCPDTCATAGPVTFSASPETVTATFLPTLLFRLLYGLFLFVLSLFFISLFLGWSGVSWKFNGFPTFRSLIRFANVVLNLHVLGRFSETKRLFSSHLVSLACRRESMVVTL